MHRTADFLRIERPDLIVYENGKIPGFVCETGLDLDTDLLTTRAFLELAKRRGAIASAAEYRERIVAVAPITNPDIAIMVQRPPSANEG